MNSSFFERYLKDIFHKSFLFILVVTEWLFLETRLNPSRPNPGRREKTYTFIFTKKCENKTNLIFISNNIQKYRER